MKAELDISKAVKKSNILNELRNANASLVEYRLFCVYLAHLPIDSQDTQVTFSLSDYARIVGLSRPKYDDLEAQSHNILKMTALIKNPDGGFTNRNLFSEFRLFREDEKWMVSLECNPKIAPLIREQKGRFLRYKLYNTIYLKSFNQMRIYELLKQYEKIGSRVETLEDLRAYLSIGEDEYPRWADFSNKVLKVSQKALKEHTDIYFTFDLIKKGKRVVAVKFDICKNEEFIDRLRIDTFLPKHEVDIIYEGEGVSMHAEECEDDVPDCGESDDRESEQITIGNEERPSEPPQDIERRESIDIVRAVVRNYTFSDDELEEIVAGVEQSKWWEASLPAFSGRPENKKIAFRLYVEAQYAYTKSRSKSKTKEGFKKYMVGAVQDNYYEVRVIEDAQKSSSKGSGSWGSFDTNEAFVANLKRTFGEDFDPAMLNV